MYVCMYIFSWLYNYKWDLNNYGLKTTGLMDPGGNYPSTLNNKTRLYPRMSVLFHFFMDIIVDNGSYGL